ncbi:MAG: hypothetical protein ACT4OP_07385 [Actinomycetota bacterium]
MRNIRTTVLVALLSSLALAGSAAPAAADHTHVRMTGNGACVILAADGGEKYVSLPHADTFAENRQHPLHVNVHLGEAGVRRGETVIWVAGSVGAVANCNGYVND